MNNETTSGSEMTNQDDTNWLQTPVLLLIFNRPDTTKRVFEAIRKARPKKLFVAADGPRLHKPDDAHKCAEARRIATSVDWDCEVKTFFRQDNVGCGKGPSGGISWFFTHVDEGIILEDDCLPSPLFFRFCTELLERYRTDTRVMEVGGNTFIDEANRDKDYSYYFSSHNNIWGWATWRRAWAFYDFEMRDYKEIVDKGYLKSSFPSPYELNYFKWILDKTYANIQQVSWWDYQWELYRRINSGLAIVPQQNMIVNIGLGADATHTLEEDGTGSDLKFEEMNFPLKHPEFVLQDIRKDELFFRKTFTTPASRIKSRIKDLFPVLKS
jgi:hypothetical protein